MATKKKIDANRLNLKDQVVSINRVTKVVKGGKNMSFAALVVIGDPAEASSVTARARPRKFPRPSARASRPPRRISLRSTSPKPRFRTRYWVTTAQAKSC